MEKDHSLENFREKEAELKEFRDMDSEAVEYIGKEFRGLVSEETLAKMRNKPSEFKTHEELAKAYTKIKEAEAAPEGLEGFSQGLDNPAQICSDHHQTINETIIHERLHQASDREGASVFGDHLEEGVTQALTEKLQAGVSFGEFYPQETEVARKMINENGLSGVEKLYFQNDPRELKSALQKNAQHDVRPEASKKLDAPKAEDLRKPQG
jgi:hypothetical protein